MAREIERKFLVTGTNWKLGATPIAIRQGYIYASKDKVVRVRTADSTAYLTIKGPRQNLTADEYEYEIPYTDANEMLRALCGDQIIEKIRYVRREGDATWEIDEFHGSNEGLVVAEIELSSESQAFAAPGWLGPEVSSDRRYANANLVNAPYSTWSKGQ